jgi:hypothetical protein
MLKESSADGTTLGTARRGSQDRAPGTLYSEDGEKGSGLPQAVAGWLSQNGRRSATDGEGWDCCQ